MAAQWHRVGTKFQTGVAMPVAWTNVDISSYVGSQVVWALLTIEHAAGADDVGFRGDAFVDCKPTGTFTDGEGVLHVHLGAGAGDGDPSVLVQTYADGTYDWKSTGGTNVDVTLIGYVDGLDISTLSLHSGVIAQGWSTLDAGSIISNTSVAYIFDTNINVLAVGDCHIMRPRGDPQNWVNIGTTEYSSANKLGSINLGGFTQGLVSITDSSGVMDFYSEPVGSNCVLVLYGHVPMGGGGLYPPYYGAGVVHAYGDSPDGVYQDLDLSAAIGARRALVFLRVKSNAAASATQSFFRENGDTFVGTGNPIGVSDGGNATDSTYLVIVSTDASGICEWKTERAVGTPQHEVTVLGFIPEDTPTPPTIVRRYPEDTTTVLDQVQIDIDDLFGMDSSTIELTLTSPQGIVFTAITGGAIQTGYDGYIANLNTRLMIRLNEWPSTVLRSGERWTFDLTAYDLAEMTV